jgi:hypothetical protein
MNRAGPEPPECRDVRERRVALMLGKSVTWIALVKLAHARIPMSLRQDRCGAHRRDEIVTPHQGLKATFNK